MINEQVLDILHRSLIRYKNTGGVENRSAESIAFDRALELVDALKVGDAIASMWWIDDVLDFMLEEPAGSDGEMSEPTDDEIATARDTLRLVQRSHNAEIGINWEAIREALLVVQEKRTTETIEHGV